MKSFLPLFLSLVTGVSLAQSGRGIHEPANPIPSSYFEAIQDMPNPSWGEMNRLVETFESCAKMARKAPLCDKADNEIFPILWQSLHRVMAANVMAKNKGFTNVCDDYAEKLVINKQYGPQASYVLLLVDSHMKAAKPMYGSAVDQVPLYRIVYNAMADESSCTK